MKRSRSPRVYKRRYIGCLVLLYRALVVVCIGLGFYLFIVKSEYFQISDLVVSGTNHFVNELDLREVVKSNAYGQNLLFYPTQKLQADLESTFLGAQSIKISKSLPDKLKIEVTEREPLAMVHTDDTTFYLVDKEGYILGLVNEDYLDLPKLKYDGELSVGKFINKDIIPTYLQLITYSEQSEVHISSVSFSDEYADVYLRSGTNVVLDNHKDMQKMILSLKAILEQAKDAGKEVLKVDLRYDKVIVLFN